MQLVVGLEPDAAILGRRDQDLEWDPAGLECGNESKAMPVALDETAVARRVEDADGGQAFDGVDRRVRRLREDRRCQRGFGRITHAGAVCPMGIEVRSASRFDQPGARDRHMSSAHCQSAGSSNSIRIAAPDPLTAE